MTQASAPCTTRTANIFPAAEFYCYSRWVWGRQGGVVDLFLPVTRRLSVPVSQCPSVPVPVSQCPSVLVSQCSVSLSQYLIIPVSRCTTVSYLKPPGPVASPGRCRGWSRAASWRQTRSSLRRTAAWWTPVLHSYNGLNASLNPHPAKPPDSNLAPPSLPAPYLQRTIPSSSLLPPSRRSSGPGVEGAGWE